MNWDDLKYFLAVAREKSISGGAKLLGVQHSTVSRRLRALEKKMGTQLIERKKSGYELTSDGEKLKKAALKMEFEVLKIDGVLAGNESKLTGQLKVTAINNMASTILMPIFSSFAKNYPAIELHIMVTNTYASLADREADVAIRLTNTPLDTLVGKRLVTIASAVYASQSYLTKIAKENSQVKWLGVTCCGFHKAWTKQTCTDHEHQFYSDDTLLTKSALKQDLGLAYLPCFMGDSEKTLVRYNQPDDIHNLGLWLLFHPDLKRNAKVLAFREHMVNEINAQKNHFEGKNS
ncbi:MAG: LysR family transcriptional regulator [Kangiella sp.]|nr:MAG: LysR family transcriptional regulator [Kangiella sp.]